MSRLLIVDDHPIFRNGLKKALEDMGERGPITEAGSGKEALAALDGGGFDVVVLDLGLPDMSGFDVLESRASLPGSPHFFMLTMNADSSLARKAFRFGASGFASKNISLSALVLALRLVEAGELYVEAEILRDILTAEVRHPRENAEHGRRVASLTERERAMLDAILDGLSAKEAAARLGVSTRTAENYQSAVYLKLGARTPVQLIRVAVGAGLSPFG